MTKNTLISDFLSLPLIQLNASYCSQDELFSHLYQTLHQQDYVETSYLDNVIAREKEYPTGLITPRLNIAIPHTDPQHIKKPFVAIIQLAQPLNFYAMGSTDEVILVDWVFALGVTHASTQLVLLQKLMSVFGQEEKVNQFTALTSPEQIYDFFHSI